MSKEPSDGRWTGIKFNAAIRFEAHRRTETIQLTIMYNQSMEVITLIQLNGLRVIS